MAAPNVPVVISVVIPTHNRCALLPDTVGSVLAERSMPIEVIVVDDASADDTYGWLESVDDPRLRPIRLDPGKGGSGARNVGLAEVRSDYVMFLDDDDLVRPGALPKLVQALERHPEAVASGGTYVTFGTFKPGDMPRRQVMTRVPVTRPIWREQLWGWNLQPGAGVWRTSVVREIGGWDESLRRCEDTDVNLRGFGQRPVTLIPDTVLLYRQHDAQVGEEITKLEWALDDEVRARFVASLPAGDREVGQGIVDSRPIFKAALRDVQRRRLRRPRRRASPGRTEWRRSCSGRPSSGRGWRGCWRRHRLASAVPTGVRSKVQAGRRARRVPAPRASRRGMSALASLRRPERARAARRAARAASQPAALRRRRLRGGDAVDEPIFALALLGVTAALLVATAWRWPVPSLIAVVVLLPYQQLAQAWLYDHGFLTAQTASWSGYAKELVLAVVLVRAVAVAGRRAVRHRREARLRPPGPARRVPAPAAGARAAGPLRRRARRRRLPRRVPRRARGCRPRRWCAGAPSSS